MIKKKTKNNKTNKSKCKFDNNFINILKIIYFIFIKKIIKF